MKIIAILLSSIYYFFFGLTLIVMHGVQWLAYNLGNYQTHHNSVRAMNWLLIQFSKILGTTYTYSGREKLPKGVPLIFVSNHQSMYDISPIEWYLADFNPKFISKIELGKGIPSVSYNLQKGGSVLIDRKDSKQAISEIKKLGQYIEKHNRSAVIFPEGTRSRDGNLKPFKDTGLKVLIKYAPSALIVPVTINNSWKLIENGTFPLSLGTAISVDVHDPISFKDKDFDEMLMKTREAIQRTLKN
jgi:1-acyl-sn-glycerol-3-phosphate acyltransferase